MTKPLSEQVAELEAERDDLQRQVQEADEEHRKFTSALGFGDGVADPSATYEQMLEPIQQAMQESLDHHECPMICELCGEWLADTPCEHCHGSGADNAASQAAMAYSECEWCAGVGRIHPGCVEKSYSDLVAEVDELRAKFDRDFPCCESKPTPPRVISAEELRAGMVVAWKVKDHHWGAGEVYDDGADALSEIRGITHIVLLEDAPEPIPGCADDDHQRPLSAP